VFCFKGSVSMTANEWNACSDPHAMWMVFAEAPEQTDLTLFGCACCRRVWHLLSDERLRRGIEVRERYERAEASEEGLAEAEQNARTARTDVRASCDPSDVDEHSPGSAFAWAAGAASNAAYGNYRAASDLAARARACADGGDWQKSYDAERAAQCDLLRSMVAYPSRAQ
jgi:hypothetical protein